MKERREASLRAFLGHFDAKPPEGPTAPTAADIASAVKRLRERSASFIAADLYSRIVEVMPIPCAEVVIHQGHKVLLIKRNQEPAKGEWWLVGGRQYKGESLECCAIRKCKEEAGLDVIIERYIGVYDQFFEESAQGVPLHAVCVAFLARPVGDISKYVLDSSSDEAIVTYGQHIPTGLSPHVKEVLAQTGLLRAEAKLGSAEDIAGIFDITDGQEPAEYVRRMRDA